MLHHKLRSLLSAMGVAIGVCMLVVLTGLSRGSLFEIADRWESVDADLIVFPLGWGDSATARSGVGLSEKLTGVIQREHGDIVQQAAPVFTWPIKLAGQDHMASGITADNFPLVSGNRKLLEGRLPDLDQRGAKALETYLLTDDDTDPSAEPALCLELVIDQRLARAGNFSVGQTVRTANHDWTIVGIAPTGVMTRGFLPLRTSQYLFGSGDITKCTLIFVKLKPGIDVGPAAAAIAETIGQDVVPLDSYRAMLSEKFGMMFTYIDAVNAIALVIAFLFVMTTLYMMVLQRTRDIAILRSCGASGVYILRQVVGEALLLTGLGTAIGLAMAFGAAAAINHFKPLLTVDITGYWVCVAVVAAFLGAVGSALYPAWRATRIDMVEALVYE